MVYLEAFKQVCSDTAFSGGEYAGKFERQFANYCDVSYAAGVNNGTTAIHMAMLALGIQKGDEVIIPTNTFIATAWGVIYTGATPVFVDCTLDTWEIDASKVEDAITERTKAIIGVHLYGQPFEVDSIRKLAQKYNLFLVEDCAHAHGSTYKGERVGGLSDMGCFSFYPGKNLGACGEAGMVLSNNVGYIEHINSLKNHGSAQRYLHDEIGYNYRLDGVQGAILSYKLNFLDEWTKRRQTIADMYYNGINNSEIVMQQQLPHIKSSFHLFVITTPHRNELMAFLDKNKISCSMHYPVPCHLQRALSYLGYKKGSMPNAEYLSEHCISLPMYPELKDEEVLRVIDVCNNFGRVV